MTGSGGQQRNSAIQMHVPILPQTPPPSRPPRNIQQRSVYFLNREEKTNFLKELQTDVHIVQKSIVDIHDNP